MLQNNTETTKILKNVLALTIEISSLFLFCHLFLLVYFVKARFSCVVNYGICKKIFFLS